MNLRLIGAPTLKDIDANMVDASNISKHSTLPGESIFSTNCKPWVSSRGLGLTPMSFTDDRLATATLRPKL